MANETRAKGLVLSRDPFSSMTADLADHRLLLFLNVTEQHVTQKIQIPISGQKLRDLWQLATLAMGPQEQWPKQQRRQQ